MGEELEATPEERAHIAEELLFLVLDYIGKPVVLNIEESKQMMAEDRRIDLQLDREAGTWTLSVVDYD